MRRTGVGFLFAAILLGTLALGGGGVVAAQNATPVVSTDATPVPTTGVHPIVGTWLLDSEPENPDNLLSLDSFSADGTYVEVDDEGMGIGAWEPTGPNTGNLTFRFFTQDGIGIIRASLEVAPDGQSLTGTYTLEFVAPDGTSTGEAGPGSVVATRLAVEPPGTPVGTFEEVFGEQSPATPEA